MAYANLDETDLVLLAVEFHGRGQNIPAEIVAALGPEVIADIQYPENSHDNYTVQHVYPGNH